LFGPIPVVLVPTSARERFQHLQDGALDLLVRTTSHTTGREELAAPTAHYFVDGLTVVVRADSGLTAVEDLDGARLAVANGTSFGGATFEQFIETVGLSVVANDVDNADAGFDALDSGAVDGLVITYSNVLGLGRTDLTIIPLVLDDPWAMWAVEPEFRDEVNEVLLEVMADGTWARLFAESLGVDPPLSAEEVQAVPPIDR
jgi:general L-amino acid transport system substrate-binding protein